MGIIILLLPLVLIFFMMQSQRKKAAAQQQLIASLVEGDDVMTTAGMYGTLTWIGKEEAFVEIADGVEIHIAKAAIARKVDMTETEAARAGIEGGDADLALTDGEIDDPLADDPGAVEVLDGDVSDSTDNDAIADADASGEADTDTAGPVSTPKRRRRDGGK